VGVQLDTAAEREPPFVGFLVQVPRPWRRRWCGARARRPTPPRGDVRG
jgi:hypothetical protein